MRAAGLGAGPAREAYIRILVTRGVGELTYDPAACPTPSVVVIVKPQVDPPREALRAGRHGRARRRSSAIIPASVNPLIKSNNLLNNALAMQEAFRRGAFEGVMRNYRGELAECTHVEPLRRQGRRGAHAAARRGPAAGHHARVPVRGRRRDAASRCARAVLRDDDLFGADEAFLTSTTRELVPIVQRRRSARSAPGRPGPVTRALLDAIPAARRRS